MYAKTDLQSGQELFFDYGYNSKSTKFVPLEHQALSRPKDSKVRVKLAGRSAKASKSKQRAQSVQKIRRMESEADESSEEEVDTESYEGSEDSCYVPKSVSDLVN